ncbi:hypothetical protein AVEN_8114-1 [Araneus ventricosus]|uniref:Uncharacterized protein n=1 Tax=Araneus ventricosus TaxID=182803 RepID=A0A4Y2SZ39_ARAVE|nr:hypothetical protein AVEN_8114-1 [Araneus ventricosus]
MLQEKCYERVPFNVQRAARASFRATGEYEKQSITLSGLMVRKVPNVSIRNAISHKSCIWEYNIKHKEMKSWCEKIKLRKSVSVAKRAQNNLFIPLRNTGRKKRAPNATSSIHPLSVSLTLLFSSNLGIDDVTLGARRFVPLLYNRICIMFQSFFRNRKIFSKPDFCGNFVKDCQITIESKCGVLNKNNTP